MHTLPQPEKLVKPPTDLPLYRIGFDAFIDHRPLEDMKTMGERRGWLGALDSQAESQIAGFADRVGF